MELVLAEKWKVTVLPFANAIYPSPILFRRQNNSPDKGNETALKRSCCKLQSIINYTGAQADTASRRLSQSVTEQRLHTIFHFFLQVLGEFNSTGHKNVKEAVAMPGNFYRYKWLV